MKKRIIVEHGLRKKIMMVFGCTYPSVRKALRYERHTPLCKKIRTYAINNGGELFEYEK